MDYPHVFRLTTETDAENKGSGILLKKTEARLSLLCEGLGEGSPRLFNRCGKWCRKRQVPGTAEMQPELPLFASG